MDRAMRAQNPIPHGNDVHWTELEAAFDAAYTDHQEKPPMQIW
jgi:hypothetical protein